MATPEDVKKAREAERLREAENQPVGSSDEADVSLQEREAVGEGYQTADGEEEADQRLENLDKQRHPLD